MAWLSIYQSLPTHRKTIRFKNLLKISVPQAVGQLCVLWLWSIDNAPDGDLSGFSPAEIAEFASWEGDADEFVQALKHSGFVDEDLTLHDWYDYAGKLIDKRQQNAERMKHKRAEHVQNTCIARAGATEQHTIENNQISPIGDIPSIPPASGEINHDCTAPDGAKNKTRRKASTLSKTQQELFGRFWEVYPKKVSVADAQRAWMKIDPDDIMTDNIVQAVEAAKINDHRFKDIQYVPHPATWLNGRGWENEYINSSSHLLPATDLDEILPGR
ncbi:MAG: hypothetical protein Q8876_03700 [Bacillota bacterium]|nr:hypothetical protein [Bacillota bacterium]